MRTINRTAVSVMQAEPFLLWLRRKDPTSLGLTLDDIQSEPTIYLVKESINDEKARRFLNKHWAEIFEDYLDSWHTMPEAWPGKRDLATFKRWFTFSYHSLVVDLGKNPMKYEEM